MESLRRDAQSDSTLSRSNRLTRNRIYDRRGRRTGLPLCCRDRGAICQRNQPGGACAVAAEDSTSIIEALSTTR
jgi:hypothetical protein